MVGRGHLNTRLEAADFLAHDDFARVSCSCSYCTNFRVDRTLEPPSADGIARPVCGDCRPDAAMSRRVVQVHSCRRDRRRRDGACGPLPEGASAGLSAGTPLNSGRRTLPSGVHSPNESSTTTPPPCLPQPQSYLSPRWRSCAPTRTPRTYVSSDTQAERELGWACGLLAHPSRCRQ